MSTDAPLTGAQYRKAVNHANAGYRAGLQQCDTRSWSERIPCRREARAARDEALAEVKARRAPGTEEAAGAARRPEPEAPSGLKASKADIAPQLQRDSPPDIVLPKK
jgi:hypothetical protein